MTNEIAYKVETLNSDEAMYFTIRPFWAGGYEVTGYKRHEGAHGISEKMYINNLPDSPVKSLNGAIKRILKSINSNSNFKMTKAGLEACLVA